MTRKELNIEILTELKEISRNFTRQNELLGTLAMLSMNATTAEHVVHRIEVSTNRILQAIRYETKKPLEKRTPAMRDLIDRAVLLYVRRHEVEGKDITQRECISHVWSKRKTDAGFASFKTFDNAVRYDLKNFYDWSELLVRARHQN